MSTSDSARHSRFWESHNDDVGSVNIGRVSGSGQSTARPEHLLTRTVAATDLLSAGTIASASGYAMPRHVALDAGRCAVRSIDTLGHCWQGPIVTFRLPEALQTSDDAAAIALLKRYYGDPHLSIGCADGAHFDTWATGSDPMHFTADDLIAIKFLSVEAPKTAVRALLRDRADEFSGLLVDLGPDRDLTNEDKLPGHTWAGWRIMDALRSIPGVGTTIASKLLARKRPRLRPIWDSVVAAVTDTVPAQWEPLRVALRADDLALHRRLLRLRDAAHLPAEVSALRILDVIAWREGKDRDL